MPSDINKIIRNTDIGPPSVTAKVTIPALSAQLSLAAQLLAYCLAPRGDSRCDSRDEIKRPVIQRTDL